MQWLPAQGNAPMMSSSFIKRNINMKAAKNEVKQEIKAKLLYWNNIKSKKTKALLIVLSLGLIGLKLLTTVLTFDWLVGLFN